MGDFVPAQIIDLKQAWRRHADQLAQGEREKLERLIPSGSRVALVDWPKHSNAGDAAIWLGELEVVKALDWKLVYVCDLHHYRLARLRARLPDVVLIHGGGNIGNLYSQYHDFKLKVMEDTNGIRLIQMPQSLNFSHEPTRQEYLRVARRHSDFHLFVRERAAYQAFQGSGLNIALCTDSAYHLAPIREPASQDLVVLARADVESSSGAATLPGAADWANHPLDYLTRAIDKSDTYMLPASAGALVERLKERRYEARSNRLVRAATAFLSQGRVAVVDRLHAHILCLLLGIPHVILDSSNGKVFDHYRTWNAELNGIALAQDPEEALVLAGDLLRLYQGPGDRGELA